MEKQKKPLSKAYVDTNKNVYELHNLTETPIIFHYDSGRPNILPDRANWHENVEILCVTRGEGLLTCAETHIPMRAGDLVVIDSGLLHRIESKTSVNYHCLIVDEAFCRRNGLAPGDCTFPRIIRDEALAAQYHKIAEAYISDDPFREAALRAAVLSFMVSLLRGYGTPTAGQAPRSDSAICTAISYIRVHYKEPIDLDFLSAQVNLSKYHFIRQFKRATGQTVIAYLNHVRVEQAERLLREGGASVASVAEACGFVSHSYFSKVFLRLRGVLPSAIAKQREQASNAYASVPDTVKKEAL